MVGGDASLRPKGVTVEKLVRPALCKMPATSHDGKEEKKCKIESSASSPESKKRKLTDTEEQCETEDWECGIRCCRTFRLVLL